MSRSLHQHQDMERDQMRMAILKQEQIFRQQVHELHRLYHVQKQLMQQTPTTVPSTRAPAFVDVKPKPELDIWHREKASNPQQFINFSSYKQAYAPAAPAPGEECNLELTLATGPSSSGSGSGSGSGNADKRLKKSSSNSDSGTTPVSSTSTDSELAQFREVVDVTAARFPGESRRMDQMGQGPWMYQCLSLRTA